jgi:hypothetical protein
VNVNKNKQINSVVPECEGSSLHSQKPANDPYPEPGESDPRTPPPPPPHRTNLPKVHFEPILPSTPWSFKWCFPFRLSLQNPVPKKIKKYKCSRNKLNVMVSTIITHTVIKNLTGNWILAACTTGKHESNGTTNNNGKWAYFYNTYKQ